MNVVGSTLETSPAWTSLKFWHKCWFNQCCWAQKANIFTWNVNFDWFFNIFYVFMNLFEIIIFNERNFKLIELIQLLKSWLKFEKFIFIVEEKLSTTINSIVEKINKIIKNYLVRSTWKFSNLIDIGQRVVRVVEKD